MIQGVTCRGRLLPRTELIAKKNRGSARQEWLETGGRSNSFGFIARRLYHAWGANFTG